ncbi:MAG: 30S ribosome-binding factor RbfA [Planctomycetota bacterium]
MENRRLERVGEEIRHCISTTLISEIADPRLGFVTVTSVDVAPDLRTAKVFVSSMGTPEQREKSLQALRSAHGRIQRLLGDALTTRYTPTLQFIEDPAVKRSIRISALLNEVLPPKEEAPADGEPAAEPASPPGPPPDASSEGEPAE